MDLIDEKRLGDRHVWALAAVFGVASVPWTYAFALANVPLWPSFIASATYYAADDDDPEAFRRATASNAVGVAYASGTLAVVDLLGGGTVVLAVVVGLCMFLASLHAAVPLLSFTPGGFFGYATMFSVHAAGVTVALGGLSGETVAAACSMAVGAAIGLATDRLAADLSS